MRLVATSRFINFYGQKGVRLTNDQTIYGFQPTRTWLIKTLSIFLFYAPELHLRGAHGRSVLSVCAKTTHIGLESVYTDFVICQHRWAHFITRLQSDWTEFILYVRICLLAYCSVTQAMLFVGHCVTQCQRGILGHTKC